MTKIVGKVALLWRGDREARATATPANNRYHQLFQELTARGIHAEPAVYSEEAEDEVRAQLLGVDGALVWVNPQDGGRNRHRLDAMLRDVASQGVWVSAHPDVILKMGTKEVLHRTRHLGWGTDTHLYRSPEELEAEFPRRLRSDGPRVLKRNRGNGGQGTWKVELLPEQNGMVRVLEARKGSLPEEVPFADFLERCDAYFAEDGCVVDQPFQPRLSDGMIRCYMSADKVVGFGHQFIKALIPPPPEGPDSPAAQPGPRIMRPASAPQFQRLRTLMETDWTPGLMRTLGLMREKLPIIWDADFLYGPHGPDGEDTYVLCEINVSSVFAIPDQAPAEIARLAEERLRSSARPA
ncbi:Cj0069 family protein [Belnapia moabensis]|uniref:Cj0069 family protein n=1 Tax=Belnapia moabensis TaxID=365533 RepID=UPI0005B845DD|nr:Cj0069 family protein [Belnapia moabensis]